MRSWRQCLRWIIHHYSFTVSLDFNIPEMIFDFWKILGFHSTVDAWKIIFYPHDRAGEVPVWLATYKSKATRSNWGQRSTRLNRGQARSHVHIFDIFLILKKIWDIFFFVRGGIWAISISYIPLQPEQSLHYEMRSAVMNFKSRNQFPQPTAWGAWRLKEAIPFLGGLPDNFQNRAGAGVNSCLEKVKKIIRISG